MTGKDFAKWMDEAGMSLVEAAAHFGVSEQTVYNWRSTRGVAESKVEWVLSRMREYLSSKSTVELPDRITLEPSKEKFDEWNRAALFAGKILREWAVDVLDEAAAEQGDESHLQTGSSVTPYPVDPAPSLKVAEPTAEGNLSAPRVETASPGTNSPSDSDEGAA